MAARRRRSRADRASGCAAGSARPCEQRPELATARRGVSAAAAGGRARRASCGSVGAPQRPAGAARAPVRPGSATARASAARDGLGLARHARRGGHPRRAAVAAGHRRVPGRAAPDRRRRRCWPRSRLGLLTTVFSAWRWCLVARGLGMRLPLGRAVADYYRALFLNAALPGGVLGDVHRAVRHGRTPATSAGASARWSWNGPPGRSSWSASGVVVLLAQPSPGPGGRSPAVPAAAPVPRWPLAAVCGLRSRSPSGCAGRRRRLAVGRAVRAALAEARPGLLARAQPGRACVLASAVVLAGHLATFLLAARAAGSTAPAARAAAADGAGAARHGLPLNVGGWGPREGVTAWAFGAAGLGAAQGLTVAVVYGVLAFVAEPARCRCAGRPVARATRVVRRSSSKSVSSPRRARRDGRREAPRASPACRRSAARGRRRRAGPAPR